MNNSWSWEALISRAGPTRGPCAGLLSRGSPLYLDAQLVMQPAISQAEGEINFLVLHGRGGEGAWGCAGEQKRWNLSDFRLQRLNPLPGLQKGEEGGVASQISSSAAAPTEEGAARGKQTGEAAALAQEGELFENRVKGGPLSLGSQTLGLSGAGALWGEHVGIRMCTHRSSQHVNLPPREVAPALVSATTHTGPGAEVSGKMLTDRGAE